MCFSAEASFVVSGTLLVVGAGAIRKVNDKKDVFIACIPLLFAFQQLTEGLLWLTLGSGEEPPMQFWLANLYGIFIGVVWPFYAPFAIYQGEMDKSVRKVVASMMVAGISLAAYTIIGLLSEPVTASIINHSIHYDHDVEGQQFVLGMYLFATCVPFILSSNRLLNITGAMITLGFFVSFYAYRETFASVWCFFAAIASALIYLYIVDQRMNRVRG
ncbi:conserved membrane hypothetical protein [Nitrosomonas nitrosa]|jgi:putative flippase GtrA|uniref:Uncharacterized protein n=1 Tax=Nitrosomonas nitrosa TaxID=52442 RepID=A0A8H8Z0Q2_9PROT|nr:DUF6629 family protein [Nitrosomonas nitrosa]CAE6511973.1 conserved membrane hypothetical protein [Nitrosomonas nitrosa]